MRKYVAMLLLLAMTTVGCTSFYAKQADSVAGRTLGSAQKMALGSSRSFDIDYKPFRRRQGQDGKIAVGKKLIAVGSGPLQKLTLNECLEIAFRNSRSFQDSKETLYSEALALASARREWDWSFFGGSATGDLEHERISSQVGDDTSGSAGLGLTFSQKFLHGAALTLGATLDLATDLIGMKSTTIGSLLEANLTQPLLRGAWRGLAYEDVYRQTRDFVFSVFEFERFTQTFATDIVTDYYQVLLRRDVLENEKANIERLKQTLTLTKVLVEGGQRSRIEQDQAEQELLDAKVRLERNEQAYRDALDELKLTLGLPIAARVDVDYPQVLLDLNKVGPKPIGLTEAKATAVAMSVRPDVLIQRAAVRDTERDVQIAADDFLPQLDVTLGISAPGTEPRKWYRTRAHRHTRSAGLTFNYDLDQTDNRDAFRNAQIAFEKSRRDYEEFLDQVRLDVRKSYRALLRSRRNHEFQLRSVQIARRRRKLAALQQKEGQASARDVLEAEEALRNAQNGLTSALVDYTTTRLEFLGSLGMLRVDEKGSIHERKEPFGFARISRRYPETDSK